MADIPVDTLKYAIDGDLAPFKAKAAQVDAEASRLGGSIKEKTANAFDGATAGASKLSNQLKLTANQYQAFAREAQQTGKSVESLIAAHFRAGSAAETAGKKSVAALAAERVAIQATAREARIAAEQIARVAARASPKGIPLQGYQITNLSQQAQDLFISLGSGQNPLTVLLQQGPQAASAAGGLSNALKLMGGAAGIARIALAGLAVGGVALAATSWLKAEKSALAFERAVTGLGRTSGLTAKQVEELAAAGARQGDISIASAQEQAAAYLNTGRIGGEVLTGLLAVGKDYAALMGIDAAEATESLAEAMLHPDQAGRELTRTMGLLDQESLKQIDSLIKSGDLLAAQKLLLDAVTAAADGQAAKLGVVTNAWDALARSIGNAVTSLGEWAYVTEGEKADQRIRELEERLSVTPATARRDIFALDRPQRMPLTGTDRAEAERELFGLRGRRNDQAADRQETSAVARRNQEAQLAADRLAAAGGARGGGGAGAARIDTGARDAELARMEVVNARALAATPLRDREALRARQQAEAEFVRNNADPRRQSNAAGIRDSRNATFEVNQADRRRQVVVAVQEEVTAQQKLAAAYLLSTAAGAAQVTQGQAHAAAIQGLIENEDEYTRVLNERAFAQAQVNDAQAQQQRALGNKALARLAAANGNPAGLEAARIENDALSQTQAIRDQAQAMLESAKSAEEEAIAKERLAAAEQALNAARRQGEEAAGYDRQTVQAANDNRARESLELREAEVRLAYANAEALAMETAAIRAYHQAVGEKEVPGTDSFARRYQQILALNREAAQLELILSGQDKNTQVIDNVRAGLEDIGMAATRGFDSARDAASSFFRQLGDLIVQLYIIQPLLNGLMGTGKGEVGGFLGSLFGGGKGAKGGGGGDFWSTAASAVMSFFGGGRAEGGPVDPGKFYLVGENGPELLGPGVGGNVIPIRPPSSQGVQSAASAPQSMTMSFTIDVSGANGDAAVAAIARQATAEGVTAALTAYDASLNRGIGAKLQNANRRRV